MAGKSKGDEKHYVVVLPNGKEEGRYTSRSGPASAARKAATKRFTGSTGKVRITVRETGSERTFTYDVQRVKLDTPFVSTIKGKQIKREYTTKIKAVKH